MTKCHTFMHSLRIRVWTLEHNTCRACKRSARSSATKWRNTPAYHGECGTINTFTIHSWPQCINGTITLPPSLWLQVRSMCRSSLHWWNSHHKLEKHVTFRIMKYITSVTILIQKLNVKLILIRNITPSLQCRCTSVKWCTETNQIHSKYIFFFLMFLSLFIFAFI